MSTMPEMDPTECVGCGVSAADCDPSCCALCLAEDVNGAHQDTDDVRRYETDATRDHDDDASHAETMRREADLLHQMCDDDRDDGLILPTRTTATEGL